MRQFILREESNAKALYAYLKANWQAMAAQDKPLAVNVSQHKDKRHNQQNRLYWSYLKQIATQAIQIKAFLDAEPFQSECTTVSN